MGNYTREEILAMAEEEDVEFIRLQFTDMFGTLKNIAITARELPRALDNQCVVYGSHIAGIVGEKEPDLILYPDYDTFSILPWRPQQGKVARLICDMRRADGSEHEMSSRYILKKTAQAAEKAGYTSYVDPECEFFLFHIDDNGMPTTVSHEKAGYLDVSPVDLGENARRDMVLTLEDMGVEVESSHHETAPAQHEIALHYGEARKMADEVMTFKMAVRTVAKRHGLHATFMPKPRREVNGSAMHIHFSLFKNGKNIFPEELEILINKLPYVSESIVIGKPCDDGDYKICAKIVYQKDAMKKLYPSLDESEYNSLIWQDIKEKVNHTMPSYKYIREIIVTDVPLIKTTTQKIKRHEELKIIFGNT